MLGEKLIGYLDRAQIFKYLNSRDAQIFFQNFKKQSFAAHELILRQGYPGRGFFLITKGKIEIDGKLPGDVSSPLIRLKPGDIFGEISLLEDSPCTATVLATRGTEAIILDYPAFQKLQIAHPTIFYQFLRGIAEVVKERITRVISQIVQIMDQKQLGYRLSKNSNHSYSKAKIKSPYKKLGALSHLDLDHWFPGLPKEDLAYLEKKLRIYSAKKGLTLWKPGSNPDAILIILEGVAQTLIKAKNKVEKLTIYGPNTPIGGNLSEIKTLPPRSLCLFKENSIVAEIPFEALQAIKNKNNSLWFNLFYALSKMQLDTLVSANKTLLRLKSQNFCNFRMSDV